MCDIIKKNTKTKGDIKYMDIRRYDILMADMSGAIGSEQGGLRPVIVIQNNLGNIHSSTTIVMPMTSKLKPSQPTHTLIKRNKDNNLKVDSVVLGEQIRTISIERIKFKIGSVKDEKTQKEIRRVYEANFNFGE